VSAHKVLALFEAKRKAEFLTFASATIHSVIVGNSPSLVEVEACPILMGPVAITPRL